MLSEWSSDEEWINHYKRKKTEERILQLLIWYSHFITIYFDFSLKRRRKWFFSVLDCTSLEQNGNWKKSYTRNIIIYKCGDLKQIRCMYVHVRMHVCMHDSCMYVCKYVCMYVYVCVYVCMFTCTYVSMYVCMYKHFNSMCAQLYVSNKLFCIKFSTEL